MKALEYNKPMVNNQICRAYNGKTRMYEGILLTLMRVVVPAAQFPSGTALYGSVIVTVTCDSAHHKWALSPVDIDRRRCG